MKKGMAKINLDKYYTPSDLAGYCVKKTKEVIGVENITEWLEPSAGAGVFLPYLDNNYLAFDIEPEAENIEQKNYLELDLPYLKGRCVIGNPPFGESGNLFRSFYNKAVTQGDYIAFIGSIKLLNNIRSLYYFDLIYSEDLGNRVYTDRELRCCLNIYKRPKNGQLNKRSHFKLNDILVVRDDKRNKNYLPLKEDFRICRMGSKVWKVLDDNQTLRNFKIVVKNKELIPLIKEMLNEKFKNYYGDRSNVISTPYITQEEVYLFLKKQIPELN